MATYASYKTLTADNFESNSVTAAKLGASAGNKYSTLWVYNPRGMQCHACTDAGDCCEQANGKCCYWSVPAGASKAVFEIWSGGGAGGGGTCCNNCMHTAGGSGGNYAVKSISTCPGCQYSVCAGGTWPCSKVHTCGPGMGCKSYINGHNLSNFCTTGACGGWMCNGDAHGPRHTQSCANCLICGIFGADFGIMGSTGVKGVKDNANVNQQTGNNQERHPLQLNVQQAQTQKRGATVHVMLTGQQAADNQHRVHIVETGQNVVRLEIWVDQEWSK